MILDHTIKTFKKKMEGFYKENEHLQSIQGERVKLVLKDKYANMENGAYTGPSFRSYKVDGNFFAFKIGTKENGQDICKRVSLRVEEGRRFLTFSKEEKDANGISLADFILGSPYVEGSFNCPDGTGIFEVYDPEKGKHRRAGGGAARTGCQVGGRERRIPVGTAYFPHPGDETSCARGNARWCAGGQGNVQRATVRVRDGAPDVDA